MIKLLWALEDVIINHQNSEGNKEDRMDWANTPIWYSAFKMGQGYTKKAILTQTLINLNICKMNSWLNRG